MNKVISFTFSLLIFSSISSFTDVAAQTKQPYQQPVFKNDQRTKKIKTILPQLEKLMSDYAAENHIPGIAYGIVVDNDLVVASATGVLDVTSQAPATTISDFRIASMTKSFTAMAIVQLRDQGKLNLYDPVAKYIPEASKLTLLTEDASEITIENLLTMTAGFPEDNPWGDRQLEESDQMLLDLINGGLYFSNIPSYGYEYSNTGFAMLGNIVSKVSGMPFQEYITTNILLPLGMNHTYWEIDEVPKDKLAIGYRWEDEQWKLEPMLHDGSYGAMGGLITTIEDFSKYVSFHLSAWPPRDGASEGPVKRSSLREMQSPQYPRLYPNSTNYNQEKCPVMSGYGFGLGIYQNCEGLKWVSHGGALPGFGSNYVFYPEYGVGLMAFCNLTYTTPWPLKEIEQLLFETAGIEARQLPASEILELRKSQIIQLFQSENPQLENEILAENFYMDQSRENRVQGFKEIFAKAGEITESTDLIPENQLRGSFKLIGENGDVLIFFTLTPEQDPKIQQLEVSFEEKK